jgi:hypothetical protein
LHLSPDAVESYGSVYRENLILSVRSKQSGSKEGKKYGKKAASFKPYIEEILKELRETGKVEPTIVYVHGRLGKPCSVAPQNHERTTVSCCMCMRRAALPIGRSTFFACLPHALLSHVQSAHRDQGDQQRVVEAVQQRR